MEKVKLLDEYIDAFSIGTFYLFRNTDMYSNPEKYNIISIDEKDERCFQSHKEGQIIDKEAMLEFYHKEYQAYEKRKFSTGDRYTLYFEE